MAGNEIQGITGGQDVEGLLGHDKDLAFYSE